MKWVSTIPSGGGGSSAIWHLHWLGLTPRSRPRLEPVSYRMCIPSPSTARVKNQCDSLRPRGGWTLPRARCFRTLSASTNIACLRLPTPSSRNDRRRRRHQLLSKTAGRPVERAVVPRNERSRMKAAISQWRRSLPHRGAAARRRRRLDCSIRDGAVVPGRRRHTAPSCLERRRSRGRQCARTSCLTRPHEMSSGAATRAGSGRADSLLQHANSAVDSALVGTEPAVSQRHDRTGS